MTGKPAASGSGPGDRFRGGVPLPVGTRLGDYEITGVVGEGGFGIVYRAHDHALQRQIAIKEYMPGSLADREDDGRVVVRTEAHQPTFRAGMRSFINEARMLAAFDHPALVRVWAFWEQNGTAYMAMPLYEGRTLKAALREVPRPSEAFLRTLLHPLLDALELLHKSECYHRDVSPDNIMILADGSPVLLDFGAARHIIGNMTQDVTVILKPGFAPIEQYADDPAMRQGPWTDVYAVAAVLRLAISGKSPPTPITRIVSDTMKPLRGNELGYSARFLDGIDRGLAVRPEHRPQSIAQFREALGLVQRSSSVAANPAVAAAQEGSTIVPTPPPAPTPAPVSTPTPAPGPPPVPPPDPSANPTLPYTPIARNEEEITRLMPDHPLAISSAELAQRAQAEAAGVALPAAALPTPASGQPHGTDKAKSTGSRLPLMLVTGASIVAVGALGWLLYGGDRSPRGPELAQAPAAAPAASPRAEQAPPVAPPPSVSQANGVPERKADSSATPPPPKTLPGAPAGASVAERKSEPALPPSPKPGAATLPTPPTTATAGATPVPPRPSASTPPGAVPAAVVPPNRTPAVAAATTPAPTTTPPPAPPPRAGKIVLAVKPWGGIYVDGKPRGVSPPLKEIALPEGRHRIEIRNTGFASFTTDIDVKAGASVTVSHTFRAP